jgi:hypothetical protein
MKPIIVVSDAIRIMVELSIQNNTNKSHAPDYKALIGGCTLI